MIEKVEYRCIMLNVCGRAQRPNHYPVFTPRRPPNALNALKYDIAHASLELFTCAEPILTPLLCPVGP